MGDLEWEGWVFALVMDVKLSQIASRTSYVRNNAMPMTLDSCLAGHYSSSPRKDGGQGNSHHSPLGRTRCWASVYPAPNSFSMESHCQVPKMEAWVGTKLHAKNHKQVVLPEYLLQRKTQWECEPQVKNKWKCSSNCEVLGKILGFSVFLISGMMVKNI